MAVERKAPMVLGIGAALAGVLLLFRKKKPELPEALPNSVVVGLWNPPEDATMWSLILTDWDMTVPINEVSGKEMLDISEVATFEIPSGVAFPLRVVSLQLTKWNETQTALIVLYEIQSYRPYLWDFEKFQWSNIPDPTYREAFIPDYGSYYYNVSKERFE